MDSTSCWSGFRKLRSKWLRLSGMDAHPTKTVDVDSSKLSKDKNQEEEFDIVIVGAGPTGLLSAFLARQLNLKVCIFDAKDGPLKVGGADAITARSQQYLEVTGNFKRVDDQRPSILQDLLGRGIKCNTSTTFAEGQITSRQNHWWNSIPHTFYDNLLMIGQPYIESLFVSHLDIPVHYNEPVVEFTHTTSPSNAIVKTAKRTVRGKYCIAADGARSFMRTALNIGWEGTKPNMVWTVMDCWIETTFPVGKQIVTLEVNGESRVAWIPRERGMQRFYVLLDGDITQGKAEATIRQHMAPHTVDFTHVEWLSRFEIKECVAKSFLAPSSHGPFILAGDAAHVHAVNGGQGMNTGLSDAFNLIWRLHFAIHFPNCPATTQDDLIISYDTERRATATEVVDVASKLVRSTKDKAKSYVDLIERNAGFITGMGVKYSGLQSSLVVESERGIFRSGERCPDLWLQGTAPEGTQRLYQRLVYGRYSLLCINGMADTPAMKVNETRFLIVIPLKPLEALRVGVVNEGGCVQGDSKMLRAYGCSWVKKGENYAVLVRPDCYIEYVDEQEKVSQYLKTRFPRVIM